MKFTKDEQGNNVATFASELRKISDDIKQNSNDKNYKYVTLRFKDVKGNLQTATGIIYEGNYSKGVEVGRHYLTTARQDGNDVYLQMSHLEATERVSSDMFGFATAETNVEVGQEASLESKED